MPPTRRRVAAGLAGAGAAALLPGLSRPARAEPPLTRTIPSSGRAVPVIGMGTWITFNVGDDPEARDARAEVMRAFFAAGGGVVDSSPMYGSSEAVIGHGLRALGPQPGLFAATKVWTGDGGEGPAQVARSERLWGLGRLDLEQVHNLVAWPEHLRTLFAMKAEGRIGHVGVTTSHGRRHEELEAVMTSQPLDAVQLTYNVVDREAEARILPLAAERGIAVIANRPFRRGALVDRVRGHPLPGWAAEIGCASWPQLLLKFIVSHPALTCAIPATTRVDHVTENLAAARAPMPDAALRRRIVAAVEDL